MANRVIYKCADDGLYSTIKHNKNYAKIEFDANDMDSLCNALNNWDLSENFEDEENK